MNFSQPEGQKIAVTITALAVILAASAGLAEGIPDQLHDMEDPSGHPIWLSESALRQAMDAEDAPAGERLESVGERLGLFKYLPLGVWALDPGEFERTPSGELICEPRWVSYHQGPTATDIAGLVELSMAILLVKAVDSEPGFLNGRAGELIKIEVLSVLKDTEPGTLDPIGLAPPAPRDGFYLWNFYARSVIEGRALCIGSRPLPRNENLVLFLRDTRLPSSPIFVLDGIGTVVSADGSFYGALLAQSVDNPSEEIARQMKGLEEIIRRGRWRPSLRRG